MCQTTLQKNRTVHHDSPEAYMDEMMEIWEYKELHGPQSVVDFLTKHGLSLQDVKITLSMPLQARFVVFYQRKERKPHI